MNKMITPENQPTNDNPDIVDSLNHSIAKEIRNILSGNPEAQTRIIIDDEENILQAIKGNLNLIYLFTLDKHELDPAFVKQLPSSTTIMEVARRTCKKLFGETRQSKLFAMAEIPAPNNLQSLLKLKKDIIVLDSLSITGNIGAIIRTANAFDIDALVFLNTDYKNLFDRRVIRSSRGYLFRIPLITATHQELLTFCEANHIKIVVTSSHAKESANIIANDPSRLAIIFGSEKTGFMDESISKQAMQVKIPINPQVESLNVSVAASIFMYLRSGQNS